MKEQYTNSDMSDDELKKSLLKLFQYGLSTGKKLEAGIIEKVDDRQWEMVENTFNKFASTFEARSKRKADTKICDHNWSLCNEMRERCAELEKETP